MSEDEAKAKWCPFARQLVTLDHDLQGPIAATAANRFKDDQGSLCLGSNCMAWRWDTPQLQQQRVINQGHCGLAGAPS